jgi:hypothetical protein
VIEPPLKAGKTIVIPPRATRLALRDYDIAPRQRRIAEARIESVCSVDVSPVAGWKHVQPKHVRAERGAHAVVYGRHLATEGPARRRDEHRRRSLHIVVVTEAVRRRTRADGSKPNQ